MADIKDTVASHISTNWDGAVVGGSGTTPTIDAVSPEDVKVPEHYPEAVLVYNEDVGWDRLYAQGALGDRHTKVYILVTAHTKSGCNKTHFRNFIDELKGAFGSAITGFDLQILDPEQNVTKTKGVQGGMYQATFVLHLYEYGVSTSSASAGGAAGTTIWAEPFVTTSASANLTNETVLSTYLAAIPNSVDIIPASDGGIDIGDATHAIAKLYVDELTINTSVAGLDDADIPNDATLTNITQITNRSHTDLTDIGTNTHAQIDTHLASTSDPHSTVEDDAYGAGWNADTTHAPSQNAVYDKIAALAIGDISGIPGTIAQMLTDHNKAAHDALGLSHDSLADVSADDHHNESHTIASHSDMTASAAEVEAGILYGSGNKAWVPLIVDYQDEGELASSYPITQRFTGTGNQYLRLICPLPLYKNGLKLYIDTFGIWIHDADNSSYFSTIQVYSMAIDGGVDTEVDDNTIDWDTALTWETYDLGDWCPYDDDNDARWVGIRLTGDIATATDLDWGQPMIEVYYA